MMTEFSIINPRRKFSVTLSGDYVYISMEEIKGATSKKKPMGMSLSVPVSDFKRFLRSVNSIFDDDATVTIAKALLKQIEDEDKP